MRHSGNSRHSEDDLDDVIQRLRDERAQASPLKLDQIKTATLARARSLSSGRSIFSRVTGGRRLVLTGLTVGLMAAGTGSVLAAGGGNTAAGNAAEAQYSTSTTQCNNTGNTNTGTNNGNVNCGNNDDNDNDNTTTNNTNNTTNGGVVNNYYSTTTTVTLTSSTTAAGAVEAFSATKDPTNSKRTLAIHLGVGHHKIKSVTVKVNGVVKSVKYGKHASPNVKLVDPPCYAGTTTVAVIGKLADGKTVQTTRYYHLCVAGVGKVE